MKLFRGLSGVPAPAVKHADVRRWTRPHTLKVHAHEIAYGTAWLVSFVFLRAWLPTDAGALAEGAVVFGPVVVFTLAYVLSPGFDRTLTIDPARRELIWHRPTAQLGFIGRDVEDGHVWSMKEIETVEKRPSMISDAVAISVDGSRIVVRVPRGTADDFVASMRPTGVDEAHG